MMKKLNLQHVIMFFVCLVLFVSCMGEGRNTMSGFAVGVVRMEEKTFQMVLDVGDDYPWYSSRIANTDPGDCLYIYYEIDFDNPVNSYESVKNNGFYQVFMNPQKLDRYDMSYSVDTTNVLPNEVAISNPYLYAYINGMGFFYSELDILAEQVMRWDLSFDIQNVVGKEENGQMYYDVFLRAIAVRADPTKSIEPAGDINAFSMRYILEVIARDTKNMGRDRFKLYLNYVSKITDEQLTWARQDTEDIWVDFILPAE